MRTFLSVLVGIGCFIGFSANAQQLFDPNAISYKPAPLPTTNTPAAAPQVSAPNTGLFPELGRTTPTTPAPTNVMPTSINQTAQNQNAQKPNEKSDTIILTMNDVKILTPPAGLELCTGNLIVYNDTDIPLNTLALEVKYGDIPVQLQFANVTPGVPQIRASALAGPSCQQFLNVPKLTVKKCIMPGVPESECKARIKFEPI